MMYKTEYEIGMSLRKDSIQRIFGNLDKLIGKTVILTVQLLMNGKNYAEFSIVSLAFLDSYLSFNILGPTGNYGISYLKLSYDRISQCYKTDKEILFNYDTYSYRIKL